LTFCGIYFVDRTIRGGLRVFEGASNIDRNRIKNYVINRFFYT